MREVILAAANTLTLGAVIVVNGLAGSGNLYGKSVGEISRTYDTLIAPAGYAFSIWGLIYIALAGFVAFQWFSLFKRTNLQAIDQTGIFFLISNLANLGWLFLWVNEHIGFSVIAMLALLLSLIALLYRLRLEMWDAPVRIILFVWWPIAIYLGWIIVAALANIAAFFVYLGWEGQPLSPQVWSIVLILVATGIYLLLIRARNLRESAVVGVWAFVAIAVKQGGENTGITIAAIGASLVLLAAISYHGYKNRTTSPFRKMRRGEF